MTVFIINIIFHSKVLMLCVEYVLVQFFQKTDFSKMIFKIKMTLSHETDFKTILDQYISRKE